MKLHSNQKYIITRPRPSNVGAPFVHLKNNAIITFGGEWTEEEKLRMAEIFDRMPEENRVTLETPPKMKKSTRIQLNSTACEFVPQNTHNTTINHVLPLSPLNAHATLFKPRHDQSSLLRASAPAFVPQTHRRKSQKLTIYNNHLHHQLPPVEMVKTTQRHDGVRYEGFAPNGENEKVRQQHQIYNNRGQQLQPFQHPIELIRSECLQLGLTAMFNSTVFGV